MSKEVAAFKCDHCGRIFKSKSAATRHEKFCSKNPANQFACFDCKFLLYESKSEMIDGDISIKKYFNCTKLGIGLHTHKAVQRNLTEVLKKTELMRLECNSYKFGRYYE